MSAGIYRDLGCPTWASVGKWALVRLAGYAIAATISVSAFVAGAYVYSRLYPPPTVRPIPPIPVPPPTVTVPTPLPTTPVEHAPSDTVGPLVVSGNWPTKPVVVVVPSVAGGATDVISRILFDRMSRSIGQPIIIKNRPGAGDVVAASSAAKAAPDGYTLLSTGSQFAADVSLYASLSYDPETDFEAISPFAAFPIVVVASNILPVNNLQELIAYAKARPGQLSFGSAGLGSSQHLAGVYFSQLTGVEITHVPYRNIAQFGPDLIAGSVSLGFQWYPNVLFVLQAKGAKALAVAGDHRLEALPDVPTTKEAGLPKFVISGWYALLAPKGTPQAIVNKLNSELAAAVADPKVRAKFEQIGAEPLSLSPIQAKNFISDEVKKYREIITSGGSPPLQ